MIAEDVEWVTVPTGHTFRGHEGMREFTQGWVDAFLDGSTEDTTAYAGEIISGHTLRFPSADGTVGGGRFAGTVGVGQPRLPTSWRTLCTSVGVLRPSLVSISARRKAEMLTSGGEAGRRADRLKC